MRGKTSNLFFNGVAAMLWLGELAIIRKRDQKLDFILDQRVCH